MPISPPCVSISSTKISRGPGARMPAAGGDDRHGTCRSVVRSSVMVVAVVMAFLPLIVL